MSTSLWGSSALHFSVCWLCEVLHEMKVSTGSLASGTIDTNATGPRKIIQMSNVGLYKETVSDAGCEKLEERLTHCGPQDEFSLLAMFCN